jgi:putative membrane protein
MPRRRAARVTTENVNIDIRPSGSGREIALWLAIVCILVAGIGWSWSPTPFAQALAAIFIGCALAHAAVFYGPRHALVLFVLCVAITFAMETLGAATGFPFGNYHFVVDGGLPRIGAIPLIVGPLWFGAGYFAWIVASILLDGADRRLGRTFDLVALPVVAAFVMTQWDLVMDRSESTIAKAWIWHDGGADFGVPLTNYLGWLLTSWLFFQAFAFYLRRELRPLPPKHLARAQPSRKLQAIAILFYVSLGLTHIVPWVMGQSGEVVDAAGKVWQIHDLRAATVVVMLFTMCFTGLLAAVRLARSRR